jgi:hypothetical protein
VDWIWLDSDPRSTLLTTGIEPRRPVRRRAVNIGQPKRIIEVEPLSLPLPETLPTPEPRPAKTPEPAEPAP